MRPDEEGCAKIRVGLPAGCVNEAIANLIEKQANDATTRGDLERMTTLITAKITASVKAEITAEITAKLKAESQGEVDAAKARADQWGQLLLKLGGLMSSGAPPPVLP